MANFIYIATSLDGYIAREDGNIDWLNDIPNPEKSDFGYGEFMDQIDGIIMGRNTFEKVLSFGEWPYTKPVFVLSRSKNTIPENLADKVSIVQGDLHNIVRSLESKGVKNLYIDGGQTITSFLNADLVDEMILTRVPVLLGDGIPLFSSLTSEIKFEHVNTEVFNNHLVKSTYRKTTLIQ